MTIRRFMFFPLLALLLAQPGVPASAQNETQAGAVPIPVPKPTRRFGFGDLHYLALAPNYQWLATGGQAGAVLWGVETGGSATRLEIPWSATALEFAPDSSALYVASQREIVMFDITTRAIRRKLQGHEGEITRLKVSPDATTLASASVDNTVRLWSTATGEAQLSVRIPGSPINDFAFSPDGLRFATVDTYLTNNVRFWDRATGVSLGSLPTTNASVQRCLYTPAGEVITVSADRKLSLWNQAGTEVIRTFTGITNPTGIVLDAWLPNETTLAAIANDGRVRLWNLGTAQLLKVSEGELTIAASGVANDHLVLTGNLDAEVQVRQLPGGEPVRVFRGHTTSTHSGVAFSPDGHLVLSGGVERSIRLWDRDTGTQIRSFTASPAGTMAAEFSEDGSLVLGTLGLPEPGVRLWNITTGEVARDFRWTASWPTAATLSRDGSRVAAGAQDQRVRIFDVQSGALTRDLRVNGWPSRLAFAPTRPWLVMGSTDSTVTVVHHENGQTRHEITINAGAVTALQFSANSEAMLVAWQDGLVRLYDTERFEVQREFVVRSGFLDAAALSPDGSTLITGESFPSFTATLWDVATGKVLRTFTEHRWSPAAVAFSRDGRSVLIGSDTVREWSIADLAPRIGVVRLPDLIEVSWNRGTLERATHPLGPWESVPGATSPWTTSTSTSTSGPESIELFRIAPALKSMATPGSRR